MPRNLLTGLLLLLLLIIAAFAFFVHPQLPVATGYAAKKMCSCHFVAERSLESIQQDDLGSFPLNLTRTRIDPVQQVATTSLFGMARQTAVFKKNLGCVLLQGRDDYQVRLELPPAEKNDSLLWPLGEKVLRQKMHGVNYERLQSAIEGIFDPSLNMDSLKTRAVVVVFKDTLIAEKYANGFDPDTEILGWSMTKSITNTLVGILVKDGILSLDDNQLFDHWTDERAQITLRDMLQMQSGLAFEEDYASLSDATEMLFKSENIVTRANRNPLESNIGTKWAYSSGTSNMLSGLIRRQFEDHQAYLRFPHLRLFRPVMMHSAVLEIDESGNYIGSSFCYATPRDWAKFGMLYLNKGNWYGEQIIDTSWVDFTTRPAAHSDGRYGSHFWLNHQHSTYPDVPADQFSSNGYEGQHVHIIPSKDLVVVRMGLNQGTEYDANAFLREVIAAVEGR